MAVGRVAILDDDRLVLARLSRVLRQSGFDVVGFETPGQFLAAPALVAPCCLVLDMKLPGVSGLEVQQILLRTSKVLPIVFISGQRDAQASIDALKSGAMDFLLKPFSDDVLISAVERAVKKSEALEAERVFAAQARERLASLTVREREVCALVADGMTSREIAVRLGIAEGTIAIHRTHIMAKLGAKSVAEVVRLVDHAKSAKDD